VFVCMCAMEQTKTTTILCRTTRPCLAAHFTATTTMTWKRRRSTTASTVYRPRRPIHCISAASQTIPSTVRVLTRCSFYAPPPLPPSPIYRRYSIAVHPITDGSPKYCGISTYNIFDLIVYILRNIYFIFLK